MTTPRKLLTTTAVAAIAVAGSTQAIGAEEPRQGRAAADVEVLERPAKRLERAVEVHDRRMERIKRRREQRRQERQATPEAHGVSSATLESIAACESGGDPTAVSANGTYRGKYQFDAGTWAAMGGSGDPAAAPEAEQDMRAAKLYAQSGSSPWPVCG